MITKAIIKKYALNKPTSIEVSIGVGITMGIFISMLASVIFLQEYYLLVGFIVGGILIGLSLSFTKNIFFPIGIIIAYNLVLTFSNNPFGLVSAELLFTTISRGIADALFVCFIVYWVVCSCQYIIAGFKKFEKVSDELPTMKKFIFGSIIAGFIYGVLMVIQNQ